MKVVTERKTVGSCAEYLEGTLDEIFARLNELRCNNDGSQRSKLRFETWADQDSDSYLTAVWERPETEKEAARRLRAETKRKEKKQQEYNARREQELKTFERLKAKFGKSP